MASQSTPQPSKSARASKEFRIGRVKAYVRSDVWYLCYYENGKRRRPRVGKDRTVARQMAAEINGQLEVGAPAALSFEPVSVPELRQRWLDHHEHILRSSLATINRYRAATDHLLRFVEDHRPVKTVSNFSVRYAEMFARYLRSIEVSPNGHANSNRRALRDKGVKYILESCRAMFSFAGKRRHLSPYAENPFSVMQLDRMPVDDAKPIQLMTATQEQRFLESCDDWQFPIFATLLLTGLRPGELVHLLLPDDLDLEKGLVFVRNRIQLGWQTKTRNEREIPILPCLAQLLRSHLGDRKHGPVFRRRRFVWDKQQLNGMTPKQLQNEVERRVQEHETQSLQRINRTDRSRIAREVWRDAGLVKTDRVRVEFMRLAMIIGLADTTAPKLLRHMFATALQDANVDPLIRNELMGHSTAGGKQAGPLGMTGHYTHTRSETKRDQLENALKNCPAALVVIESLRSDGN